MTVSGRVLTLSMVVLALVALIAVWTEREPAPRVGETIEGLMAELQVLPVGRAAPQRFTLRTLDGGRLDDVKGPALLYFWATW